MKAARVRSAASAWNVRRQVSTLPFRVGMTRGVATGSAPIGCNWEALSTVAAPAGGPVRSSEEAPVMGVEPRGRVIVEVFARATEADCALGGPV